MASNAPLNFSAMATNAKLAEFSYANFDDVNWNDSARLVKQLKKDIEIDDKFAQAFVDSYKVVAHQPNTDSGFSATVVRDKTTNHATVMCRGTEMPKPDDLAADAQILANGYPIGQTIDMRNFMERLKTPKGAPILEAYYDYKESSKDKKRERTKTCRRVHKI